MVALGVARVAMGAPLFAIAAWLSWLLLRPPREGGDERPDPPRPPSITR